MYICTLFWYQYFMKQSIVILSLVFLVSCSGYNRALKTDDFEEKRTYANTFYNNGDWSRAAGLYEQIYQRYSQGAIGEEAYFRLGEAHFKLKDYYLANYYFSNFAKRFFFSNKAEEALFLSALSAVYNVPAVSLDQAETYQALNALQEFMNQHPQSNLVDSCNRVMDRLNLQLEEKSWQASYIYYKTEHYRAAAAAMDIFIQAHPNTKRKEEAMYLATRSQHIFASNSIKEKQLERYEELLQRCDKFGAIFPDSRYSKEINDYKNNARKFVSVAKGENLNTDNQ